jgi:transcriptional regulator with XRE-family HTH domain
MTGPQLRVWRTSHDLTLREVADRLSVTHTTISRWEADPEEIPSWATDKLLGKTEIQLPLNELHQLLDIARTEGRTFQEIMSEAIRALLRDRTGSEAQPYTGPDLPPLEKSPPDNVRELPRAAERPQNFGKRKGSTN